MKSGRRLSEGPEELRLGGGVGGGCSRVGSGGGEARGSEGRVIWGLALGPDISSSLI